jgi:tetratricopeptide (TPR) repeat protein
MHPIDQSGSGFLLSLGVDGQNPWPGLVAFTEELQQFFYGRVDEADELLRRVARKNLTVLFGQSGLGKSSLLQAGLFPRLRAEGYLPVAIRLDHAPSAPPLAEQVSATATRAILDAGGRSEAPEAGCGDSLWEQFHRRSLVLETSDGQPIRPVLIFDQFEELFAIGQASEETRKRAAQFLTELADLVENRAPEALERRLEDSPELVGHFDFEDRDIRMLVSLREDYLPPLESLRQPMPSICENRMRLTRMSGMRALEAVSNPGGRLITGAVSRQVVRFVAGAGSRSDDRATTETDRDGLATLELEPSLLSLVCRELNNRRIALGLPQITADLLAGSRERILQDYYERCVADQAPGVRSFVEDELVTDSGLRENIALERARRHLIDRGAPPSAIEELVKRRLLHVEERLDIRRVELTHDVLTQVVKKSRDDRQQKEATLRAESAAREAREKARQQRTRLGTIVAGMAAALVVVSALGIFSLLKWQEAERQKREAERQKIEARQAREEALKEKERAEQNQKLAEQSFNEKRRFSEAILDQLNDKRLRTMPGTQPVRKVLFELGVNLYEGMFREKQNDPSIQVSLADRYAELGQLQSEIDALGQALEPLRKGERVLRRLLEEDPASSDFKFRLGVILYKIGYSCWEHHRVEPGIAVLRESVQLLSKVSEADPKNFEYSLHLALARTRLAALMNYSKEELAITSAAYESFKRLAAERPQDPRALIGLARVSINRGGRAIDTGAVNEAEQLYEEARQLAGRATDADPNDPISYINLRFARMGLSKVYARTGRLAKAVEVMNQVADDIRKLAVANPAVAYYQLALAWVLDDLRKLRQQSGDLEAAIESMREIVRVSEGVAQRDPEDERHVTSALDASQNMAAVYQNSKREANATAVLDKVIRRADSIMKQHPASDNLLGKLLQAHQTRAELSFNIQQYEKARAVYQAGVDLFRAYSPSTKVIGEISYYNYLQCCRGLFQIAKEKSSAEEAIAIAKRLIVPLKIENFTDGDYKQTLLGELLSLSALFEDAGNIRDALELRLRAVEESKKILGGDPKSNWYIYQQVFGAHQHLARLYRKVGDERHEFTAIRDYLRETQPYVREKDHSALLAQTAEFTPKNLVRLRDTFKALSSEGGMKRFTIPTDFDGIKYPFQVYVTDSWQFLDDQFTWVLKVRGGKVPQEVQDSFRRLYKIAKENRVSFMDLCVYALGTASGEAKGEAKDDNANPIVKSAEVIDFVASAKGLDDAKKEIQAGKGGALAKKRLALRYAKLAADAIAASDYFRADDLLSESRKYLSADSPGPKKDSLDRDLQTYMDYVLGALLSCTDKAEEGYKLLCNGIRNQPANVSPEFAVPAGSREFALGWVCRKLHHPVEAVSWYRKAMDLDHSFAADRLYLACQEHQQAIEFLPDDLKKLLLTAGNASAFARLVVEHKQQAIQRAAALNRRNEEAAQLKKEYAVQLQELAGQYRQLASFYDEKGRHDEYRKTLTREYDARGRLVSLNPSNSPLKDFQADVACRIARSYLDAKQFDEANLWATRALLQGNAEPVLRLAEWYEKPADGKSDPRKAEHYRYLGHITRGNHFFRERKYELALPDLKKGCESTESSATNHNTLAMCYGKLGRWDEAITSYKRSVDLDLKSENATGHVLNLLEALTCAERSDELLAMVDSLQKKGWNPPKAGAQAERNNALLHGFRAIALLLTGKDASEPLKAMKQITMKRGFAIDDWTWDELNYWLKTTNIGAVRKAAVEKIIAELQGTSKPPAAPTTTGG